MSVYQTRTHLLASLSLALLLASCGAEETTCPKVAGYYQALYTPLQGTCGPIPNPFRVPFDGGRAGVMTKHDNLPNARVTTDIVMKGCKLRMTQQVHVGTMIESQIDGEVIEIESEDELTGLVTLTRWANGQIACQGVYDARFTKEGGVTIGAAAQ